MAEQNRAAAVEPQARSLFCLSPENVARRQCLRLVESRPFEMLVLLLIVVNCVQLAMTTPTANGDYSRLDATLDTVDDVIVLLFTLECALKVVAYGFVLHPGAYLRSGWNVLDFIIVISGIATTTLQYVGVGSSSIQALRAFRVLRPLRLVSGFPSLQIVLNSIVRAMIPLLNVAALVLFFMVLFAIAGQQLFCGTLQFTCVDRATNRSVTDDTCGLRESAQHCQGDNIECARSPAWPGPNNGITTFDNFATALLTVFQCLSLEGWSDVLYWANNANGQDWPWIYFVGMVMLGTLFALNLVLGVLSGQFGKERDMARMRAQLQREKAMIKVNADVSAYLDWIYRARSTMSAQGTGAPAAAASEQRSMSKLQKLHRTTRRHVYKLTKSKVFYYTVLVLVLLNSAVIATEHFGQPDWLNEFQRWSNMVFVCLFTMEQLLKLYALGLSLYWRSTFNRFDLFVVVASIIEIVLTESGVSNSVGMSVLRSARLLRSFKVTRYWGPLSQLVKALLNSIRSVISLLLLLTLFMLTFALLGMQIFGGRFNGADGAPKPRTNFDSFFNAMMAVFQILTGEDWNAVMYDAINAYGGATWTGLPYSVYFVLLFTGGNYILLNLFLAIAVDNLEQVEEGKVDLDEAADDSSEEDSVIADSVKSIQIEVVKRPGGGAAATATGEQETTPEPTAEQLEAEEKRHEQLTSTEQLSEEVVREFQNLLAPEPHPYPPESAFYIFGKDNRLRRLCYRIINTRAFTTLILVLILLSSVALAFEDTIKSDTPKNKVLRSFDYVFTSIFTLEIVLKCIALGFALHSGAYCRTGWHVMDLTVVAVSWISILISENTMSSIRVLRALRVLRPLRAVSRANSLKRVIECVLVSIQSIGTVSLVFALIFFVFGNIGVQLFAGSFSACTDTNIPSKQDCRGTFITYDNGGGGASLQQREWKNADFNFDNLLNAMVTLFCVLTFEGWPGFLWMSVDADSPTHGPVYNNQPAVALYYVAFIIVSCFFMLNIFVGFVIITFQNEGERDYEQYELDKNQRKCIDYALHARPRRKFIPAARWQHALWRAVISPQFDALVLVFIVLNAIQLAAVTCPSSPTVERVTASLNLFFTVIFIVEAALKMLALKPSNYFSDGWNVFDFIIVCGSVADAVINFYYASSHLVIIDIFRLFRVLRLLKLLNQIDNIRFIMWTFIKSFQSLPWIMLLILLIFFVYSVIGMTLFGNIRQDADTPITRNNNFASFPFAMLLLFRCMTGEAWQLVMLACSDRPDVLCHPLSDEYETFGAAATCGNDLAYPYFISFFVVCAFLILNLFVAVIMDNFEYLTQDWSVLGPHHLAEFVWLWADYDPSATGRIKHSDLVTFLKTISPPLGFGSRCPQRVVYSVGRHTRLVTMNMPLYADNTVGFNATLFALVRTKLNINIDAEQPMAGNQQLRRLIKRIWKRTTKKQLDNILPLEDSEWAGSTVGRYYAIFLIQEQFRKHRLPLTSLKLMQQFKLDAMPLLHQMASEFHAEDEDTLKVFNEQLMKEIAIAESKLPLIEKRFAEQKKARRAPKRNRKKNKKAAQRSAPSEYVQLAGEGAESSAESNVEEGNGSRRTKQQRQRQQQRRQSQEPKQVYYVPSATAMQSQVHLQADSLLAQIITRKPAAPRFLSYNIQHTRLSELYAKTYVYSGEHAAEPWQYPTLLVSHNYTAADGDSGAAEWPPTDDGEHGHRKPMYAVLRSQTSHQLHHQSRESGGLPDAQLLSPVERYLQQLQRSRSADVCLRHRKERPVVSKQLHLWPGDEQRRPVSSLLRLKIPDD